LRGKALIILAAIIIAALGGLAVVYRYLVAPELTLRSIHLAGDLTMSENRLRRIAELPDGVLITDIDPSAVERRLSSIPLVRTAEARLVFPDTLRVELIGRRALGLVLVEIDGESTVATFDSEGVVFQAGSAIDSLDLPVISGVRFERFRLGARLPDRVAGVLADLEELKQSEPGYYSLISELRLVERSDGDLEIIMYPVHHRVPVRLGSRIDATTCAYIVRVLDVLDQQGSLSEIAEIDFRTDDVVYTMREE
jgi:cell division protein FtsQ